MENIPTVMSLGDDVGSLPPDGLTFAMAEDDSGLNYAYIIHLPMNSMQMHHGIITADNVHEESNVNGETKFTPNDNYPEGPSAEEASNSLIVFPESMNSSCDTAVTLASINELNASINAATTVTSVLPERNGNDNTTTVVQSRPIEIQYLDEGVFLHDGQKCDVENLIFDHQEVPLNDIKCDPLTPNNLVNDNVTTFSSLTELTNDQVDISSTFVAIPKEEESFESETKAISSIDDKTGIIETAEVNSNNHLNNSDPDPTVPKSTVRKTYGKPKADNPLEKVTSSLKDISQPIVPPKRQETRPVTKIVRIAEVHVKQSQRLKIHIPVKKRRLIIDAQKQIPIPEFKRQLTNTKDIVVVRNDLAPGTKEGMKYLELGSVAQFFSSPGRSIPNMRLLRLFTNNLIMLGCADAGAAEDKDVAPLNADLRFPDPSENENGSISDLTENGKVMARPLKRLINLGKPLDQHFKGLRKPPVFKEYRRIQRKSTAPYETKTTLKCRQKLVNDQSSSSTSATSGNVNSPLAECTTIKIEETIYSVGDGDSVVLKSHGIIVAESSHAIQNCNVVGDLEVDSSVNEQTEDVVKQENENHYTEDTTTLLSGDLDDSDPVEPKIEDIQFTMSPGVPVELFNDQSQY